MSSSAATKVELGKPPRRPVPTGPSVERPLVLPVVLVGSLALHGAILALASMLPGPPQRIAGLNDEIVVHVMPPEPVVEPEPEPEVPEPEPEPAPAAAEPPPRVRAEPPPPPAPVMTATEEAAPSDWDHPEGDPEGELGGQVGGVVGGTGTQVGAAQSEATPEPRRGVSRAELRRQLLGYIRGPLSRYIAEHTSYPISARRGHLEGVVVLRLRLDHQGHLLAVRLSRSSGHSMLDDAALSSVRGMSDLPAPPDSIPWDASQELPLPVTYRLN